MVSVVAKISRGTLMDQVYLPKNRPSGLEVGTYVLVEEAMEKPKITPFYYQVEELEPIKVQVIQEIFGFLDAENILIIGSFLERGFGFEDIDIILIGSEGKGLKQFIKDKFGLEAHILSMDHSALQEGFNTDPLFQMFLNKFATKKRIILRWEPKIDFKLLDLHLLKSKILIDNFDYLTGKEKYKLVRNALAIKGFLESKEISLEKINKAIEAYFGKGSLKDLKDNLLEKSSFIKKFKKLYNSVFEKIMKGIKNAKQK